MWRFFYIALLLPAVSRSAASTSSGSGSTSSWSTTPNSDCGSSFFICGEGSSVSVYEQGLCGDAVKSDVQMNSLLFDTNIQTRYARTEISSSVQNNAFSPRIFNYTFVVPETAMISKVSLTINGIQYTSRATQKDRMIISTPTSSGTSVRDSTNFGIRLTLAARANVVFSLTYEELLNLQMSEYTHKVHISPGQVVPLLQARIRIKEPTEITALDLKPFTNDAVSAPEIKASISKWSGGEAQIDYVPSVTEQIQMAELFQEDPEVGLNGYLAVSYAVLSPSPAGQLFVHNNYFVHFFAPSLWTSIPKHALFVLDVSGSMSGVKIQQLKDALVSILNHLDDNDLFTVVEFSSGYRIWDLDGSDSQNCHTYQATSSRISTALAKARAMQAGGGTSMNSALQKALQCAKLSSKLDPILIVLTDGQATDGTPSQILANVKAANTANTNIFSLAFGREADFNFLHSLAHGNGGRAHIIYEGTDAAHQLEDFYSSISSPLLMDVSFAYSDNVDVLTRSEFRNYFRGSELVTAGRLTKGRGSVLGKVTAKGPSDRMVQYSLQSTDIGINHSWQDVNGNSPVERLWAFLTVAQRLEDENYPGTWTTVGPLPSRSALSSWGSYLGTVPTSKPTSASPSQTTLLALQYSFVTPSTCIELDTSHAPTAGTSPGTTERSQTSSQRPTSSGTTYPTSPSTPTSEGSAAAKASVAFLVLSCLLHLIHTEPCSV